MEAESHYKTRNYLGERIIREPSPILGVNWINPKYAVGSELKVLIENLDCVDGAISVSVIEKGDETVRWRMFRQLRYMEEENEAMDFTQAHAQSLVSTYGKSLFITEMQENIKIMCRAVIPIWTPRLRPHAQSLEDPSEEVDQVYLLDYAKHQKKVDLTHLNLLVEPAFYDHPPLSVRMKLTHPASELDKLTKKLRGQWRDIRVTAVEIKTSHYGRIKETWIDAEFI